MPQVRVVKENRFTQVENQLIQNPRLSLKAKGLLIYMLSLHEDWDYSIAGLATLCREGKSAIRSAIQELMGQGYVTRELVRAEKGALAGYEYTVYERPQPSSGNPAADGPTSGKRTQKRINPTNTVLTNTNPQTPTGGETEKAGNEGKPAGDESKPTGKETAPTDEPAEATAKKAEAESKPAGKKTPSAKPKAAAKKPKAAKKPVPKGPKPAPDHAPELFAQFWARYPRKRGKQAAIRAWERIRPDEALCGVMLEALGRDAASRQWNAQEGRFIPHPATWLNQGRWEDEGVDLSLLPGAKGQDGGYWADDPEVCG